MGPRAERQKNNNLKRLINITEISIPEIKPRIEILEDRQNFLWSIIINLSCLKLVSIKQSKVFHDTSV